MLLVIASYFATLLIVAICASKQGRNTSSDFITSSRDHGTWLSALSASAASESGWVTLGLVGVAYTSGISCLWFLPGTLAGYAFNWCVLGPKIHSLTDVSHASDVSELFRARFKNSETRAVLIVERLVAFSTFFFLLIYAAAQFSSAAKAFSAMFGWDYHLGVIFGATLIIAFTAVGGLRAGSWTDVPQAALMFGCLAIFPIYIIATTPFQTNFFQDLKAANPAALSITGNSVGWALFNLISGWIFISLGYPGQPHVLRRFMTTNSKDVYRPGAIISLIWSQIVFIGAILIGLAVRVRFPNIPDPEQALPHAAVQLLPGPLAGLALASVLSAIVSTANGMLFEASSAILPNHARSSKSSPFRARLTLISVGALATLFAIAKTQVIFSIVLYAWGGLGAGIGATLPMALLWKRATPQGVIAGLIVGPSILCLWKSAFHLEAILYELIPAYLGSLAAVWIVSVLTKLNKRTA